MLGFVSWVVWLFGAIPLGTISLIVYKKFSKPARPSIQKVDWQKDMVYLYQFILLPKVRTISPFALKLETWLRMNNIKYESIETLKFSKKGQIPYIELDGEEIADSNIIISTLKKRFSVDPDAEYDRFNNSIAHSVTSMVENHTAITGFHYRYGYNMPQLLKYVHANEFFPSKRVTTVWGMVQPYGTRLRSYLQGIGRHELEEVWEFARQDLLAISSILGDKPFLLGDEPCTVDCTLFGHLVQFLYLDIGFPQRKVLIEECPNLVAMVERMKEKFWPDWETQMPKPKQKSD